MLRWHKLLHMVCALRCETTCTGSTVKVLFIVAYVSVFSGIWLCEAYMCVLMCKCASRKSILQESGLVFLPAEWWQSPARCSNTEPSPQVSQAYFQRHIFQQPQLGLFGSSWHDRVIGLHRSLSVFDNPPHLLSKLSGQAAYKSFTDLINCLKSAPLPGK